MDETMPGPACDDGGRDYPLKEREAPITMARRRELIALAENFVTQATKAGVKGREWCFLRQAAEMLTDR